MNFKRISALEAKALLESQDQERPAQVVDIRDEASYTAGHIPTAIHLHNGNLQEFINSADLDSPLLVCCYHGNTSQGAAAYMAEQGFSEAYSIDGGFAAWRAVSED